MDYPFENLGPERFQQFCQSLLTKEFAGMVCLPVGQPDGGRDALRYLDDNENFAVFQVKFARTPPLGEEARKWVLSSVEPELPKIQRLVKRGAKKYFFITNVAGTAHLDTGSIDRLRDLLQERLPIPVDCWWRDDLSRRLDGNWNIKLCYPALLTGQDFLRLIVDSRSKFEGRNIEEALKAFLVEQYREDSDVKFKVADLHSNLLDLFVDLPFKLRPANIKKRTHGFSGHRNSGSVDLNSAVGSDNQSTSKLLLGDFEEAHLDQVVVEGAPGQGKSTLGQFLCQVHRIRILEEEEDFKKLTEYQQNCPIRIPFRIDLRDLAIWLNGGDPFQTSKSSNKKEDIQRTLETFLITLVSHSSGGFDFTINDLVHLSKLTPLLIVLDGLDEVADIEQRQEVVDQVSKAIPRLRVNCPGLRVIVTSRPAAFANSPGFDKESFSYLALGDVGSNQIRKYAEMWMDIRKLGVKERREFQAILENKISQPHMRDLARNPMQLAILLNLIHKKGLALPDQRTSLYTNYIELLLDRESEKSDAVRKHRNLINNVHAYIAWELHLDGEKPSQAAGRITREELATLLNGYLQQTEYDMDLGPQLMEAMLDRVRLIVSRIEGVYEFSVQPLREYFAARFLYFTASYSPQGPKKPGTKPDRFDAIARNSYWLNIVRFYCGFYSEGELLSLADQTKDLIEDPILGKTSYPVKLASMLLRDWVFDQSPKATKLLVSALTNRLSIRKLLLDDMYHADESTEIPIECGGDRLVEAAYSYLEVFYNRPDVSRALAVFIKTNRGSEQLDNRWQSSRESRNNDLAGWLEVGHHLGCLQRASREFVRNSIGSAISDSRVLRVLHAASRHDCALLAEANFEPVMCGVFTEPSDDAYVPNIEGGLYLLPTFLGRRSGSHWHHFGGQILSDIKIFKETSASYRAFAPASQQAFEFSCRLVKTFDVEMTDFNFFQAWKSGVDDFQAVWGFQPALLPLLSLFRRAGVSGKGKRELDFADESQSLVRRMTLAWRARNNSAWWKKQAEQIENHSSILVYLSAFWTFASASVLLENAGLVSEMMQRMTDSEWAQALHFIPLCMRYSETSRTEEKLSDFVASDAGPRFALMSALRNAKYATSVFNKHFQRDTDSHPVILKFRQVQALACALKNEIAWDEALAIISDTYRKGACASYYDIREYRSGKRTLPAHVAHEILSKPDEYPNAMWWSAEAIITKEARKSVRKVTQVVRKHRWFNS